MNRKPSRSEASMHKSGLLLAGFVAVNLAAACGDATGAPPGSVMYVPPPAPAMTGAEQHASPQWPAAAAGAAAPSQPIAAAQPPAAAPSVPGTPAATPLPASAAPATPPASAMPATPPMGAAAPAGAAGSGGTAKSGFNAGAGTLEADGKTVIFRIPDGTGGKDWNARDKPIRVQRGMTLRLIDDDKSTRSGGHWLHTNGQPCPHGLRAIGSGFDCVIGRNAPFGIVSGTFEHNVANGLGRLYIEVVNESATTAN